LTGSCEKRGLLATEGKRKSEGVLASAASVWLSRGERMANEAQFDYRLRGRFSRAAMRWPQSRPAAAAIAASTGRNRVRLFLYMP
jgi:hypothetical protein